MIQKHNWLAALIGAAAVIHLSWTNPSTNKDGTPCHDLSFIQFEVAQAASANRYWATYHIWWVDPLTGETIWRSHEGERDSCTFTLPCASGQYTWWRITAFAVDFSGNMSDSSNTISVTAPSPP